MLELEETIAAWVCDEVSRTYSAHKCDDFSVVDGPLSQETHHFYIVPRTFGNDPIPRGTNVALIAGWLVQEFALASRHLDAYHDGVPNVVVIVYFTKNDELYRKMSPSRT